LTQAGLAGRLGVHPSLVGRAETGAVNWTIGQLARFAAALDADLVVRLAQGAQGNRAGGTESSNG